jgi:hypothetical protein
MKDGGEVIWFAFIVLCFFGVVIFAVVSHPQNFHIK